MAKSDFITYNNAGIVEAIKRNSGSTKFYKPSFQGIIEAIQDWGGATGEEEGGGGGTSVLPGGSNLPNVDNTEGDLVVIPNGDGNYFMYVFADGSWERLHITTEEVETAGSAPFALVTDDGVTLRTQKDINAYLNDRITALSEKGYDDTDIRAELAQEVTDRTEGDQALQDQIDALEGYDDSGIKGELAQEVTDRTESDQALQDQIDDALAVQGQIIERVEELPTWISEVPPVDKQEGDLWFDIGETGQLYVRYNDDWVVACPPVTDEELAGLVSDVETLANTALNKAQLVEWSLNQQSELVQYDQERQDRQIYELEEEIETLAPTYDRGKWTHTTEDPLVAGQYAIGASVSSGYCIDQLERCMRDIPGFPDNDAMDQALIAACNREAATCEEAKEKGELLVDDWSHAAFLHFHPLDANGKEHTFADYQVGKYIDLFDQEDDDYGLFQITAAPVLEDGVYKIGVTPVQYMGTPGGLVRLKVFELGEVDTVDLVHKSGDTMTGKLRVDAPRNSGGLWVYAPQGEAGEGQADATQLVRVANSRNHYVFYIEESGAIAGKTGMVPTDARHLTSKKYVDEAIAEAIETVASPPPRPAQASWIYGGTATLAPPSHYFYQSGSNFYLSLKSNNGLRITQKSIEKAWGPANGSAFEMSFWLPKDSATNEWELIKHVELDKIYWEHKDSRGDYCLRFHKKWQNNEVSFYTQAEYFITVGGFF